jgi:hypothetical protein
MVIGYFLGVRSSKTGEEKESDTIFCKIAHGFEHTPASRAEVKERVELCC